MEKIETVVFRQSDDENTVAVLACNRTDATLPMLLRFGMP